MGFINHLLRAATTPAFRQFQRDAQNPQAAQARVWDEIHQLLRSARYWGTQAKGRRLEDFPISDFATYRAELDRLQNERESSLSGEEIIFWAESGGTSGPPKLFPLTQRYRKQFQRTMAPYLHANARRFPGFGSKPVIYLASLQPQRRSPAGIDIGYISGFNYRHLPAPLKKLYVFPPQVFKDADSFAEFAPIYAAASDISAIFAITPAKVEQFLDLIWSNRARILASPAVPVARKHQLENVFALRQLTLQELWPSLSLVGCWKTAACALQLAELERRHVQGRVPVVDAIFSATEGWTTVPVEGETGGVLHPGAHFVEFHEAGTTPQASSLLRPWELEPGRDYEIFLTTAMGLVRYRLYDVLRCTGYWQGAPILEFVQKAGNQISLGTMRVTERELIACLGRARVRPSSPFLYAPNARGNGLVFLTPYLTPDMQNAQARVDHELQALSFYYRRDIEAGLVKPIEIQILPADHAIWRSHSHAQEKPRLLAWRTVTTWIRLRPHRRRRSRF